MDIKNISDLASIVDLCRKKGIESIVIGKDSIEFKLAEKPKQVRRKRGVKASSTEEVESLPQYTEEEALFWSSSESLPQHEGAN